MKRNRKAEAHKEQRRLSLQESQLKQTAILLTEMESAAAAVLITDFNFTEAQAAQFLELLRARYQTIQAKVPVFASPKQRLGLLAQRVALAGMQVLSEGYGFGPEMNDAWLKRLIEEGNKSRP